MYFFYTLNNRLGSPCFQDVQVISSKFSGRSIFCSRLEPAFANLPVLVAHCPSQGFSFRKNVWNLWEIMGLTTNYQPQLGEISEPSTVSSKQIYIVGGSWVSTHLKNYANVELEHFPRLVGVKIQKKKRNHRLPFGPQNHKTSRVLSPPQMGYSL